MEDGETSKINGIIVIKKKKSKAGDMQMVPIDF